jgi:poly-beta-1,6-N-acetyl-D-glucosamine synthase
MDGSMTRHKGLTIAVGVFAHNEEQNIENTVISILGSKLELVKIKEIVVVSSGSNDRTNQIVRGLMKHDKRIKLLDEAERNGKSAAINIFLEYTTAPIVVTVSADVRVSKKAIEEICRPFLNPDIGMVGAHPVPMNCAHSQIGREVKLLWELHHQISLIQPKCGEMVAFRNIIRQIPPNSAVDEATVEVLLRMIGYSVAYAPLAVVFNKGPLTLDDFFTQRRRVMAGHQWVFTTYNYRVSTMTPTLLIQAVLRMAVNKPQVLGPLVKLMSLEVMAQAMGWIDFYIFGRNPFNWKMIRR